jgi:hypothetical protein
MKWDDDDKNLLTVTWFSAGVSSAVATKLMIDSIDKIIYTHIDNQHADSMRFVKDCEGWFGKEVEILQSSFKTVEEVCLKRKFVNSPYGAACTGWLKRKVRIDWEQQHEEYHLRYVWGMDSKEKIRADNLNISMPAFEHIFPLIDRNMTKAAAHKMLKASKIKRPAMYDLGYANNNCLGCVKGGKGYWNHIRVDFPEVFKAMAIMERKVGHSCINGTFLDELDPESGRFGKPVVEDCGILCEVMGI